MINFVEPLEEFKERKHVLEHKGDYLFLSEVNSAKKTFHKSNKRTLIVIVVFFAVLFASVFFIFGIINLWILIFSMILFFYFSSLLFKAFLILISILLPLNNPSDEDIEKIEDKDLPPYTILVPMYQEGEMITSFVNYMKNINYPKDKLDIRLLLEEDDTYSLEVAENLKLESPFSLVKIPKIGPRTKPKALNVGIIDDVSEILTIYDAEDRPDLDQLKKIAWSFKNLPKNVVCIQAKLTFYNANENLLTKWFFAEYHSWFNHFLPALFSLSLPIPLGGTSNHFKTSALKEIGAWDPYNVTEDADLGIRISRLGYKISMIESSSIRVTKNDIKKHSSIAVISSPTYEEANNALGNWMKQRSRWLKGYLQTSLVHLRNPVTAVKDLSFNGFFSFFFFLLGTPIGHLINLFAWTVTILWLVDKNIIPIGIPEFLLVGGWVSLIIGNLLFISIHIIPALISRKWRVAFACIFIPIYWLLMSIATIIAIYELLKKPHHWNKTKHGLSNVFF